jgi:hypothetical protein
MWESLQELLEMCEIEYIHNEWGEMELFMVDNGTNPVVIVTRDTETGETIAYHIKAYEVVEDSGGMVQNMLDKAKEG